MTLTLRACLIMAVYIDVGSSSAAAVNVTDSSFSPNPQSTINNDFDRKTPDSKANYYDPMPNFAVFHDMPWRSFDPLARLHQTRGMMFGELHPFWGGMKGFGMPPMLRMALDNLLFGDDDRYAARYPGRYGPYGMNPYGRYRPGPYTSPTNEFNSLPPGGSPYYDNQLAQSFQTPTVGAPPYYRTRPGMPPFIQSQRPFASEPYYGGQLPAESGMQTALPSYDRDQQRLPPNARPQPQASPSYYAEQPAASGAVQPLSVPTSASRKNGEEGVESQLEKPPTLSNSRDQGAISSSDGHSKPVRVTAQSEAPIRRTAANEQPQYTAAG